MAVTNGEWTKQMAVEDDYVENVIVEGITISGAISANHIVEVQDSKDKTVFYWKCPTNNDVGGGLWFSKPKFFSKLKLTDLDSTGPVIIHIC
uniref:Uncharacterized protein n=1 Tax=viral metagenome TaxID=1070528 RepID=A0A6M3LXT0_9ZZZZ